MTDGTELRDRLRDAMGLAGQVIHRTSGLLWIAAWATVNLVAVAWLVPFGPEAWEDWRLWQSLGPALADGTLYEPRTDLPYVWSPLMAPLMYGVTLVGYWPWAALHVLSLALLKDVRLIAAVIVSWAFWTDAAGANTMTFVLVAGVLAMRGSRPASLAFLALTLLMPRPIQLPLAVWLLWQDRGLWRPALVMGAVYVLAILATGYLDEWVAASIAYGGSPDFDLGPGLIFGEAWLLVGVPLAILLTWRGMPGWAGLAVSPYLLPQYLMWPLIDLGGARYRHQQFTVDRYDNPRADLYGKLTPVSESHARRRYRRRLLDDGPIS